MRVKALKTHKKSKAEVQSAENKGGLFLALVKGVIAGLCVALLGILIFAFLLRFTSSHQGCINFLWRVYRHEKTQIDGATFRTFDWTFVHNFRIFGVLNFGRDVCV